MSESRLLFGGNRRDACPKCLGTGKASDLHTATVEAAAAAEEFYAGHRPKCARCNGTGVDQREAA